MRGTSERKQTKERAESTVLILVLILYHSSLSDVSPIFPHVSFAKMLLNFGVRSLPPTYVRKS